MMEPMQSEMSVWYQEQRGT